MSIAAAAPHAVQVQSHFRGVVTGARLLTPTLPLASRTRKSARAYLGAGGVLAALSLAAFVVLVAAGGGRRSSVSGHGVDLLVLAGLATAAPLSALGLARRRQPRPDFTVGWRSGVDAPLGPDFVPAPAHPLVVSLRDQYLINATPAMSGEVRVAGQVHSLAHYLRDRGPSFLLPPSASVRLSCGASSFSIAHTDRPARLPHPRFRWDSEPLRYSAAGLAMFVLVALACWLVPPDARALSFDLLGRDRIFVSTVVTPKELEPEAAPRGDVTAQAAAGAAGQKARGLAGPLGDRSARTRDARIAVKGAPDSRDLRVAKQEARDAARTAGILGVLARDPGSRAASIFGAEQALGPDAQDFLGVLVANREGDAWGGGLGGPGSAAGAGGTGEGTIGVATLHTVGKAGGGPAEAGWGSSVGRLHTRHATVPEVIPGIASVRGSLDKEIVRRIVRRHMNEIRYCYEQELPRHPSLAGRLVVQFAIAGTGQVATSALQSSSLGNTRVERCMVQAVHRWEFPQPGGGGVVLVSYPFVLTPVLGSD